jgi:hypothetical protein
LIAAKINNGLVVNLKPSIDDCLPQVHLKDATGFNAHFHVRLEEAIGPASIGFGAVHRQVRILQNAIEMGAVLWRKRDADAGVCGQPVTETFIGCPDRAVNSRHEVGDIL